MDCGAGNARGKAIVSSMAKVRDAAMGQRTAFNVRLFAKPYSRRGTLTAMKTITLNGTGILVTRPSHQADALCELIAQRGGTALRMPVIDIVPTAPHAQLDEVVADLPTCDIALFISRNAVHYGVPWITQKWGAWPERIRIGAVGQGTTQALASLGLRVAIAPATDFSSEGLLAHAELQHVAGQRIVIFRGIGGRESLAETLRERGAHVDYAEVYRRTRPAGGLENYLSAEQRDMIKVILVTSNEGLDNLYAMADERLRSWLLQKQLIVVASRTAQRAHELGFMLPAWLATQASDEGLLAAVCAWREQHTG